MSNRRTKFSRFTGAFLPVVLLAFFAGCGERKSDSASETAKTSANSLTNRTPVETSGEVGRARGDMAANGGSSAPAPLITRKIYGGQSTSPGASPGQSAPKQKMTIKEIPPAVKTDLEKAAAKRAATQVYAPDALPPGTNRTSGAADPPPDMEMKKVRFLEQKSLAESGDANSQYNLGRMYAKGEGVEKDEATAIEWYLKAAEGGSAAAQHNLGLRYTNGQGVEKDMEEALRWFTKAAEAGYVTSQANLGVVYQYGLGVEKNLPEASKWFTLAANQGYEMAQYNLGEIFANGPAEGRNDVEAYKWFALAAARGNKNSEQSLQNLAARMSPEQIEQARKLAQTFVPQLPVVIRPKP